MAEFRVSVHKVRDSVIKAKEGGVKDDGKLTYSRLQEWEGVGISLKSEAEGSSGIQAQCFNQELTV